MLTHIDRRGDRKSSLWGSQGLRDGPAVPTQPAPGNFTGHPTTVLLARGECRSWQRLLRQALATDEDPELQCPAVRVLLTPCKQ
jgi:hypothetical protein